MPAEGVLQYHIEKEVSLKEEGRSVVLILTDGFIARRAELQLPRNVDVTRLPDARLQQLWRDGEAVPMRAYRQAGHRASMKTFDEITDVMWEMIEAEAEPSMSQLLAAVYVMFDGGRKQLEWDKLTAMLASATEDERRKFMALIALIALSRG